MKLKVKTDTLMNYVMKYLKLMKFWCSLVKITIKK